MIKITKQNLGEYFYKASNITTVIGGLLIGHGLGGVFIRADAQNWIELGSGLLIATGSVFYRARNSDKYDPRICRIKKEITETENQISGLEEEIKTLERRIRDNDLLIDAYVRRN